jgi:hypothetical protein
MFQNTDAQYHVKTRGIIGQNEWVLERFDRNVKPSNDRDLLPKTGIVTSFEEVAARELSRAQITQQLTHVTFAAAPIQDIQLCKWSGAEFLSHFLYEMSQVDVGILSRRIRQETMRGNG